MFAKDVHGRMRFVNPAALALIGKPNDQVIGHTDADFLADAGYARAVMENDQSVMNSRVSNVGAAAAVMVVDDNEDAGEALAALLGMFGHKVTVAADGTSALLAARAFDADVFILDIGLPDMDGFELATRLRTQPRFANATLIALTGYGQPADRIKGKEAGFDHYFVKPVNIEELSLALGS